MLGPHEDENDNYNCSRAIIIFDHSAPKGFDSVGYGHVLCIYYDLIISLGLFLLLLQHLLLPDGLPRLVSRSLATRYSYCPTTHSSLPLTLQMIDYYLLGQLAPLPSNDNLPQPQSSANTPAFAFSATSFGPFATKRR